MIRASLVILGSASASRNEKRPPSRMQMVDRGKTTTHPAFFTFGFPVKSKHELVTSQTQTDHL